MDTIFSMTLCPAFFLKKYMTTTNKGLYSMKVSFTMNLVTSTMRGHGES